jgi:hypothetical protein
VLRQIEQKIESLFEGAFGRAFRRNVQPVELARKLAKEMDDYKMVSVSQVYAPNEYVVYLSPGDRDQFESYEPRWSRSSSSTSASMLAARVTSCSRSRTSRSRPTTTSRSACSASPTA